MKISAFIVLACLITGTAHSQHYYNDLVMTNDIIKKRTLFQQQRVKMVQMTSLDNNNQPIEGFSSNQSMSNNFAILTTTTVTSLSGQNETMHFFNSNGQLMRSVDSSDGNKTVIEYTYDAANQISSILSQTFSPGGYINKEQHIWQYKAGKPERMLKVKNNTDTTYVIFTTDEKGNVAEEKSTHAKQQQPTVYYYYDDQNRLTDVVRYNARAKRLLPDYVFEYDAAGRISSMLATNQGGADYQRWYYKYNEKGLKSEDVCFGKNKAMIGKVQYEYKF